jgi:hypothetical protein
MEPTKTKLKEYAGGWITEREDAELPTFLKFAYIFIAFGAAVYFVVYMYGDVNQPERGPLVKAMDAATESSAALMYAIAALIVIFGVIVVAYSFAKPAPEPAGDPQGEKK